MENPGQEFEVHDRFQIKGRGFVLLGRLKSGEVNPGDKICFSLEGIEMEREISGIHSILNSDPGKPNYGILISTHSSDDVANFMNWEPKREVARVFRNTIPPAN